MGSITRLAIASASAGTLGFFDALAVPGVGRWAPLLLMFWLGGAIVRAVRRFAALWLRD